MWVCIYLWCRRQFSFIIFVITHTGCVFTSVCRLLCVYVYCICIYYIFYFHYYYYYLMTCCSNITMKRRKHRISTKTFTQKYCNGSLVYFLESLCYVRISDNDVACVSVSWIMNVRDSISVEDPLSLFFFFLQIF